jgi:formylglycine-generating enzyme required for sulfatase activity
MLKDWRPVPGGVFVRRKPPEPGQPRVVRGGSWNNQPVNARSAYRNTNEPDNRNNNIGFRVGRVVSR